MKTKAKKGNTQFQEKKDVYQMVTDLIITNLENGVIAWRKPWTAIPEPMPINYVSKKAYSGLNTFILGMLKYEFPFFMTVKQANDLGGHVRKGEKGSPVIFWTFLYFDKDGNKLKTHVDAEKKVPHLKYYTVFNVAQIDGIEFNLTKPEIPPFNSIEACEQLLSEMEDKPLIEHDGLNRAYYSPLRDKISLPIPSSFETHEHYYATLFHELIHSTGHQKRLNRAELVSSDGFGKENYSKEELTAEFGASFLCALTGIENNTIDNSVAYIKSWINALKNDKKLLISAASKAQKAVDYICGKNNINQIAA